MGFGVNLRSISYCKVGLAKCRGINIIPGVNNCPAYLLHQMLGVLQSLLAACISCLRTLLLTSILSCKKMLLQSVNLQKDFFSTGQWPWAQQVARMG